MLLMSVFYEDVVEQYSLEDEYMMLVIVRGIIRCVKYVLVSFSLQNFMTLILTSSTDENDSTQSGPSSLLSHSENEQKEIYWKHYRNVNPTTIFSSRPTPRRSITPLFQSKIIARSEDVSVKEMREGVQQRLDELKIE